jgi:hypothetical protein
MIACRALVGQGEAAGVPQHVRVSLEFQLGLDPQHVPTVRAKPPALSDSLNALFRPDRGIAAGTAGRWDHRHVAALRRRRPYFGVDARRRTQHAVRFGELVPKRIKDKL